MSLIDKETTLKYFNPPDNEKLKKWCEENNFMGVDPTQDYGLGMPSDTVLAAALWYAKSNYPTADNIDIASYAGLVAYLATGWYGGFGTEFYEKERQAEHIIIAMADGYGYDGFYMIPDKALNEEPTQEFTEQVLQFLEQFYFNDKQEAVINLIDKVEDKVAAKLILSLTNVQEEYKAIAQVANAFLRKKATPKQLREAVRKVIPRVAPQKVEPRKQTKLDN